MINVYDDCKVELLESMGDDLGIVRAARVSTLGANDPDDSGSTRGLLSYLMKNRHGSPFEHGAMTFYVQAPIFVFREFHRHRIGFSYNEMSGRYKELPPNFYTPPSERPMTQTGKPGAYELTADGPEQDMRWSEKRLGDCRIFELCWEEYQRQLDLGIPREMARTVLPVAIMSEMYVTCNPRSMMSFLSLRVDDPNATFHTKPQWEIHKLVADKMETQFNRLFPITSSEFRKHGRVSP